MGILARLVGGKSTGNSCEHFWKWFAAHEAQYRDGSASRRTAIAAFSRELSHIAPGLTFEFGRLEDPTAPPLSELAIGAGGVKDRFPVVKAVVKAAPFISGWRIVAFRQRQPSLSWSMTAGGIAFDLNDIWFQATRNGINVDIRLFIRGLTPATVRPIMQASFPLLESVLGEYDAVKWVGALDWHPLPADPVAAGLKPLHHLPSTMDALKTATTIRG